eukprot:230822-Pleurochrysis_carterae.AAC.1
MSRSHLARVERLLTQCLRVFWKTAFEAALAFIFLTVGMLPTAAATGQLSTTLSMSRLSSWTLGT